ncbi:putative bifunctional diguanylate cyclase/phosphodiesterase [Massilia sp. TSP1-1-2]|uniref:putative bifunctional diguanylate cyclase/phosphodiesterase n=1 Tax=unclassified Massilia TaxID=2609279 RepID=UPI003CEC0866
MARDDGEYGKQRLELVMEAAGMDLWENDLVTGAVTRKAAKIFAELGYTDGEAAACIDDLFLLVHPDDVAGVKSALAEHLAGVTSTYRCQFRLRSSAGQWVWYANHGKIMGDDTGVRGHRLIGVTFNIDERRRHEEQIAEQQRQLVESEREHRELLRNLHTAIVVHAPDTSVIYCNPHASALLGLSPEQMRGKVALDVAWCFVDEQGAPIAPQDYPVSRVIRSSEPLEALVVGVRRDQTLRVVWLLVHAFPEFDGQGVLRQVVVNFDDISPRRQAEEKIHHLAFFDSLTGLANRHLLMNRLQVATATSARSLHYGAVMFIDLDKFKAINDVLGHAVGDQMLMQVAQRILGCVRETDTVARIGGDEFAVLLGELDPGVEAASQSSALVAEKIRRALTTPFYLKGSAHHSSPSIGVSLFVGNGESADVLLRQADMAMYKAKDAGRNTMRFFSAAMQLAVETHAALEADLRHAVGRGELSLHYQVQIDADARALGAEALARWTHPTRGAVSPLQFIPIAEESSLILDIGDWVLATACAQLARWHRDARLQHLTLAVNVSARQFHQSDFVPALAALLGRHAFDAARLKLELTESVVLNDVADMVTKMVALRALGVSLSMDDFGTGYSSLSYLKQLPLDQIKIDQSFVRDITTDATDAVMVKTIIDLARNFHFHVIAEGVETQAQLDFLQLHGCTAYQGYLFSKPVPIAAFEKMLETHYLPAL